MAAPARRKNAKNRKGKGRKGSGVLSPAEIRAAERRAQAIELRLQGWDFATIGKEIGVSKSRAHELVDEALAERVTPAVDEMRKIMLERLEALMTAFFPNALNGDAEAGNMVLSLMARQAQITGMNAPIKVKGEFEGEIRHSGTFKHEHTGTMEVVFVAADGKRVQMIEGVVNPPPKPLNGNGSGSNGHGSGV